MTQAAKTQASKVQPALEFPTANGAFRAARIAFVQALWHREIVEQAHVGFLEEMATLGFGAETVERFETPGAFEIPLHAQTLARTGRYAAIVGAALRRQRRHLPPRVRRRDGGRGPDAGAARHRNAGLLGGAHAAPFPRARGP